MSFVGAYLGTVNVAVNDLIDSSSIQITEPFRHNDTHQMNADMASVLCAMIDRGNVANTSHVGMDRRGGICVDKGHPLGSPDQ